MFCQTCNCIMEMITSIFYVYNTRKEFIVGYWKNIYKKINFATSRGKDLTYWKL